MGSALNMVFLVGKAARVLRDPGTTSSWKSPISSSRSAAAATLAAAAAASTSAWKQFDNENVIPNGHNSNSHMDSYFRNNGKEKRVFLYNWKTQKSSSEKSAIARNDLDEDYESRSVQDSVDDSLSDARNAADSKSDTYLGDSRSSSMIFRCRDANLVSPSMRRAMGIKKKSKKTDTHLDILSRYQQKEINLRRLLKSHPSIALGLGREDSVEQSDDTEDYSNSEDLRKISGASPLLIKLKHKRWSHSPSKLLRISRKEDSSYTYSTPALSTSSYNRYCNHNPSTVGSWDGTTASVNDGDDEVDDHLDLPGRQGCGIPCYWSKRTPRHRGVCGSCCSPSLSDTIQRKGTSMLCGRQSMYHRRWHSSSVYNKRRISSRSAQGLLPLLANSDGRGGSSIGTGNSDDELSTNFGELDLEALSRLDGRRWSSCRSQDGLEIVALNGDGEEEGTPENIRSLSQKYKPLFFGEVIGQNIVVQSLINAISRGRIAPVYLFQGPRGTGKTSTARIFASALNCISTEETKPCGYCRDCSDFISGKARDLWEVDGTNKKGIDKVRHLLKKVSQWPPTGSSRYKVFLIDECHLLPSKMWLAFLKFLEEPPQRVVFIFITTDPDNVPRTVQSRCQKYLFNKIKDGDIVARLRKVSSEENLDVELDALDLIALNADGSLRDAETMLDQLSLLGKRITTSLVNELVGVVPDEKLLELLELSMSSDTAETVKRARDLLHSGVDPLVLMSQLASLIMDIIAGTHNVADAKYSISLFGGRSLTEAELERLKHALKLLSEAEKQLRVSSDRSTWFTATLLQLGSVPSPDLTQSSSSRRQSSRTTEEDPSSASREVTVYKQKSDAQYLSRRSSSPASLYKAINGKSSHRGEFGFNSKLRPSHSIDSCMSSASRDDELVESMPLRYRNAEKLDRIWEKCIANCHSNTLRQLLHTHGKLFSLSEVEGALVVYVAFGDEDIKARAERFMSSITNSIEMVLRCNVEVRIIFVPDGEDSMNCVNQSELQIQKQVEATMAIEQEKKANCVNPVNGYSDAQQESRKLSRGSFNDLDSKLKGGSGDYLKSLTLLDSSFQSTSLSAELLPEANTESDGVKETGQELPMQRIESIIREQRLETAWLQAAEKGTPGSLSRLKPEKNQVLPQEDCQQNQMESASSMALSSQHWEHELNDELKVLKMEERRVLHKDQIGKRADHYPISPSLLHGSNFVGNLNKESLGYESSSAGGGCSGLFCWNANKSHKVNGTPVRYRGKGGRFSLFGECGKHKKTENRIKR
ncbi:replication factor C / DNA polymerase III gamma-tau subunit, putative [Ricinus communis]|uniref:Replication factor C / DNA polymerase III gamma-tau subunit, putative n=1 Tax=Ricinus communis TaxID=3988 RepID=B9S048_RICCO|nr:replication factor C / DNA polymerase III gamma-tau subunit, putative [Ricinus communis]